MLKKTNYQTEDTSLKNMTALIFKINPNLELNEHQTHKFNILDSLIQGLGDADQGWTFTGA